MIELFLKRINKVEKYFYLVFIFSVITRVIYFFIPKATSWDGSVYIGMAEYMISSGQSGQWEAFRPYILPIIFTPIVYFFKNPLVIEKIITTFVLILSLVNIYLIYKIGEQYKKYLGVISSFLLSISMPLFIFAKIPMTETFSVTIVLVFMFFLQKGYRNENIFILSIISGIAFLLRFPLGILLPVLFIFIILEYRKINFDFIKSSLISVIGFFIITVPYFLYVYGITGDPLFYVKTGHRVIGDFTWLYDKGLFFYITEYCKYNPHTIFLPFGLFIMYRKRLEIPLVVKNAFYTTLSLGFLLFLYFTIETHKELRYIVPVVPVISIIVSYFILWFYQKNIITKFFVLVFFIIYIVSSLFLFIKLDDSLSFVKEKTRFYSYLYNKTDYSNYNRTIIATNPAISFLSHRPIIPAYNTWEDLDYLYEQNKNEVSYVFVNSCDLHVCNPMDSKNCILNKNKTILKLEKENNIVYKNIINQCELYIYERR